MIKILLDKLNIKNYSIDNPEIKDFASPIYQLLIEQEFEEWKPMLPESIDELLINVKNEISNSDINVNSKLEVEKLLNLSNISELFEMIDDLIQVVKSNQDFIFIFFKIFVLIKVFFLSIISLQNKKLTYYKDDIVLFFNNKIQYSQTAIAKEWEIDNDTLSKWFSVVYGTNPFENRKKINLSEYIQIFKDFFIKKEHVSENESSFMVMDELLGFYNSVAIKGKTYYKKDIIEEGFDLNDDIKPKHYEQAKYILSKKFDYYNSMNKFPFKLADELIFEFKKIS